MYDVKKIKIKVLLDNMNDLYDGNLYFMCTVFIYTIIFYAVCFEKSIYQVL